VALQLGILPVRLFTQYLQLDCLTLLCILALSSTHCVTAGTSFIFRVLRYDVRSRRSVTLSGHIRETQNTQLAVQL